MLGIVLRMSPRSYIGGKPGVQGAVRRSHVRLSR
jgi:hypothetical protein